MTNTPPIDDVKLAVQRARGHAIALKENARYDPAAPSGLTNADAEKYGTLLDELADALEASPHADTLSLPREAGEALVERLRALMAKATAGPWETEQRMSYVAIHGGEIPSGGQQTSAIGHATIAGRRDREKATANAALIVAMRNALPDLLEAPTDPVIGREGRDAVIEECARVAENCAIYISRTNWSEFGSARACITGAIRALKANAETVVEAGDAAA